MNTKNSEQTDFNLGLPACATPVKNYRAPVYRVALVRDGSLSATAPRETVDCPSVVADLVRKLIGDSPQEHLVAICVDARTRVIGISEVSRGTLSSSLVHPRETFRTAILLNAAALIVAHNHPSGDCAPSADDREATRRLVRAGEIIGIPLMDHIVVADGAQLEMAGKAFFSFREHGIL